MLFCCLWRNVETSYHKHFVVVSRHPQTQPLTTSDKCHNLPRSGGSVFITPDGRSVDSTRWSQMLVGNRDFCIPHLHSTPPLGGFRRNIAMTFVMEKLEWCGYPIVKQHWRYVYLFQQNVRTWQTDGQTDRETDTALQHRPHLHSIARQESADDCMRNANKSSKIPFSAVEVRRFGGGLRFLTTV